MGRITVKTLSVKEKICFRCWRSKGCKISVSQSLKDVRRYINEQGELRMSYMFRCKYWRSPMQIIISHASRVTTAQLVGNEQGSPLWSFRDQRPFKNKNNWIFKILMHCCIDLGCSIWDLRCIMQDLWLWHLDTLVVARGLSCSAACEILVLCPGMEPASPGWQGRVPKAMFLSTTLQGSCDSCESTNHPVCQARKE